MRDFGWGYAGFSHVLGAVLYGIFALLSIAVTIALIFLLVRFLIYGTKAAQLYIEKNSPPKPTAPTAAAPASSGHAPAAAPAPGAPAPAAPAPIDPCGRARIHDAASPVV
jgi:hypothetical protein